MEGSRRCLQVWEFQAFSGGDGSEGWKVFRVCGVWRFDMGSLVEVFASRKTCFAI